MRALLAAAGRRVHRDTLSAVQAGAAHRAQGLGYRALQRGARNRATCERAGRFAVVTLHLGDCLDFMRSLPAGSVDAVVTDPPYCSGGFSETGKRQAKGQGLRSATLRRVGWFTNDNMTTGGLVWLLRNVAVEAKRIMVDGASLLVFTDWRMVPHLAPALESSGLRYQNMIVWDKGNIGLGVGFRAQHEIILQFVKGTGVYYAYDGSNIIGSARVKASDKEHQTEKPVELLIELSRIVSPIGATVFDPFMGSGTTGVACVKTGRNFIGCEIDPTYYAIAQRRIALAQMQPMLPGMNGHEPQAEQVPLFVVGG